MALNDIDDDNVVDHTVVTERGELNMANVRKPGNQASETPKAKAAKRPKGFRSKWDLLTEAERSRLTTIPCTLNCTGCGEYLATEADFAKHFHIPDRKLLNLGECPHTDRGKKAMALGVVDNG